MPEDASGGAATEVAPAESQGQQATEAPQGQPAGGDQAAQERATRRSVRQAQTEGAEEGGNAKERARSAFLERQKAQSGQPRDDQGRFATQDEGEEAEQDVAEQEEQVEPEAADGAAEGTEAAPDEAADEAATEPGATDDQAEVEESSEPPPDEGLVHVPLQEGHPLRDMGLESIPTTPEGERALRAALNSYTRTKAVEETREQAQRAIEQRDEEIIRLRAQLEASTSLREKLLRDPEIRSEYEDIRMINPEAAERWLRGIEAEQQPEVEQKVEQELEQHRAERREQQVNQTVASFRQEMSEHVRSAYPQLADLPHLGQLTERAFQSYGAHLDYMERQGRSVNLDRQTFIKEHLTPAFLADPQVRQRLQKHKQAQERKRREAEKRKAKAEAKAEAKKEEEQKLRDAAERHSTKNPAAQVPSEVRTGQQTTPAEEEFDPRGKTASEIKEHNRRRFVGGR